ASLKRYFISQMDSAIGAENRVISSYPVDMARFVGRAGTDSNTLCGMRNYSKTNSGVNPD
ncbi:MAG: hypothetical protein OQK00_11955, partial [Rhodobacteraceae bacterium]|nr:hypothetical protein [Paracoccaceae bacterium]